jgi:hypothetical protein
LLPFSSIPGLRKLPNSIKTITITVITFCNWPAVILRIKRILCYMMFNTSIKLYDAAAGTHDIISFNEFKGVTRI